MHLGRLAGPGEAHHLGTPISTSACRAVAPLCQGLVRPFGGAWSVPMVCTDAWMRMTCPTMQPAQTPRPGAPRSVAGMRLCVSPPCQL